MLPQLERDYYEPFLGGGSTFFHLSRSEIRPFRSFLGDSNLQLMKVYSAIKLDPEGVIDAVTSMAAAYKAATDKRAFYEREREFFNDGLPKCDPARFIFLNATCWNGLWRTNSSGRFNVPYGAPRGDDVMPTPTTIRNVSAALQSAELRTSSWRNVINTAGSGDFVFLDPPYFSDIAQNGTKYGAESWGETEHLDLAQALLRLHDKGSRFLLTNSGEVQMEMMYRDLGLSVHRVLVARAISSKPDERKPVGELVVTNPDVRRSQVPGLAELELLALD